MGILDDIDRAAYDIMRDRVGDRFLPVAKNFNIVKSHSHPICNSMFDVYSYSTRVAMVKKNENGDWETFVHRDAFHHSTTTSKHLRRFVSAMVGRVDFDALYKACDRECDRETIHSNGEQFIRVREVA